MEWTADPMTAGEWIRDRLDDDWTMHHFVPRGFEAYARIFHPAQVRSLPDRPVPTTDEWSRMTDAERQRLAELLVDAPASWADAAAAFGTTTHALAQWQHLIRTPTDGDWHPSIAPDGREFSSPNLGDISPQLLAAIARLLVAHTSTADTGYAAIWEGRGGLLGGYGGTGRRFIDFTDKPPKPMRWACVRESFAIPFRQAKWQSGILSDDISKGARLELPDRGHVLFSAVPAAFADPEWILDAPWRDREAEDHGFSPSAQHPSILWRADRAWVMTSEIDYESTIVAGSAELIRAICADLAIEALPIREGSSLHWDADELNR